MSRRRRWATRRLRRLRLRDGDIVVVRCPEDAEALWKAGDALLSAGCELPRVPIVVARGPITTTRGGVLTR